MPNGQHPPSSVTVVRVVLVAAATLAAIAAAYSVRAIVVDAFVALFLAIGLDPAVRWFGRRMRRGMAVAIVFGIGFLIFGAFVASVTPPLVTQTTRLVTELPDLANNLNDRSETFRDLDQRFEIRKQLKESAKDLAATSASSAVGAFQAFTSMLFHLVTVAILLIYFMVDLPDLIAGASSLVPASRRKRTEELANSVFERISGYLIGQGTVSLIAGSVAIVVLTLLKVPFSLPLGIWVGIAALIPMVGATLGAIPAVIVAFASSFGLGVAVLIFYVIYQQIENYLISPRVMRSAVNISPAAVLIAALIGGSLLGFVGALVAIPAAASLKVLAHEVWIPRQTHR